MKSHPIINRVAVAACLLVLASGTNRAEMTISGLDEQQKENVLALTPLSSADCDSAPWRVERLYRNANEDIRAALRALGYYEPRISKSMRRDEECWHAEFQVDAGEPVRLRTVDIDIRGDARTDQAVRRARGVQPPQPGDILNHGRYRAYKQALLRAANEAGYFEAEFDAARVVVDKPAHAADLTMHLDSGEKYRFGEVTFTPDILRERLLQGYTDIRPGDPYSAKLVNDLYEALGGSSYFASVSIDTEPLDKESNTVPVDVHLVAAKRRVYSVGAGFSTDLGPNGRFKHTIRRINDRGHQFDTELFGSPVITELNATYRWPKKDPRYEWFSIVTGVQHEKTDTSEQDSFKLGFLRSRSLGPKWLQTRYLDYLYEDFTVAGQESSSQLIIVGSNWETAPGRVLGRAPEGYRLNFDVRGASKALGSDTSFMQLRAKAKYVWSLGDKTRALARTTLGATFKDRLSRLPASVRFFAGGDNSVRGYGFETLGPTDGDGKVLGGSYQLDFSLELDRLVRDKWAVAVFVDTGDAFDQTDIDLNTGVGIGLRWYSPVGPLRLDLAHPLDDPNEDYRIHISLGPDL